MYTRKGTRRSYSNFASGFITGHISTERECDAVLWKHDPWFPLLQIGQWTCENVCLSCCILVDAIADRQDSPASQYCAEDCVLKLIDRDANICNALEGFM